MTATTTETKGLPKTEYILDNDEEVQRLRASHLVYKDAQNGRLVLAPIDFSAGALRILDSGTSDGTWLLDLRASLLPSTIPHTYTGADLSPQHFPSPTPPLVSFTAQNITSPWPPSFHSAFDLVHQRLTLAGAGPATEAAVKALCRLVRPGGWIQLCEAEQVIGDDDGPAMHHFLGLMREVFATLGCGVGFVGRMAGWVREEGFVGVREEVVPTCIGAKVPREELREGSTKGALGAVKGLVGFAKTFPDGVACMRPDELDSMPTRFEEEMRSQGGFYPMRIVWGQRPAEEI